MKRSINFLILAVVTFGAASLSISVTSNPSVILRYLTAVQAQNLTVDVSLPVEARIFTASQIHIGQLIQINAQRRQLTLDTPGGEVSVRIDDVERIEFPQDSTAYRGPNLPVRGATHTQVGNATWGPIALSGFSVADAEWGLARIAGVDGVNSADGRTYVVEQIQFNSQQNNMTVHVLIYQ